MEKEKVLIECFGDSVTEGFMSDAPEDSYAQISYPQEMKTQLLKLFSEDGRQYKFTELDVKNYGQAGSILYEDSTSRLSGNADIVLMLYVVNNFIFGEEYEGLLEKNIETITGSGSKLFLLNYPVALDSSYKEKAEQANNLISHAAQSLSVTLIDANRYFAEQDEYSEDELFGSDGIHLTQEGYILLGDFAAQQIHDYYYQNY